jgi:hypothetical protein
LQRGERGGKTLMQVLSVTYNVLSVTDVQGHGQILRALLTAQSIPHQPFHKRPVGLLIFLGFFTKKKNVVRNAKSSIMAMLFF